MIAFAIGSLVSHRVTAPVASQRTGANAPCGLFDEGRVDGRGVQGVDERLRRDADKEAAFAPVDVDLREREDRPFKVHGYGLARAKG